MTKRYPGGYITKTAPTVSTTSAPGIWTMEQQAAYQKAGTWPFGGPFNYIEDVFSTWLYTGNGSTQTITNGIDLSGQGGLTWIKSRSYSDTHRIFDTARGVYNYLDSASTAAQNGNSSTLTAFNANGFSIGASTGVNQNTSTYASWTFRKQPKFFDVVTYTGDGTNYRDIPHSLGSTPGCVIVKQTSAAGNNWRIWHRSLTSGYMLAFTTAGEYTDLDYITGATSTTFQVGTRGGGPVNASGSTYVAYLFAHNAGGFGLTGTDNVISCGSYTTNGSGTATVNLGYEPQFVIAKASSTTSAWLMNDNMRGFTTSDAAGLFANTSGAEGTYAGLNPTATGFTDPGMFGASTTVIYIAIRRGPMKTPTSGTSVFDVQTSSGAAGTQITTAFPIDLVYALVRTAGEHDMLDRLRGISNTSAGSPTLDTTTTDFESSKNVIYNADQNVGYKIGSYFGGISNVFYNFRRAPGFFDEVCYTGTGSARTVAHNLGVAPELMIVKSRSGVRPWDVYAASLGNGNEIRLNETSAAGSSLAWNNTTPTSTVFSLSNGSIVNAASENYVAYLFASCPGVSKVGSYTGTGGTQTISCGFAARFVFIKRTDSTGNWWVWDTARGMVSGTDPRLTLNTTDAELNNNWVYTDANGFQIVTTDATVNASGGSYIYLAIS